MKILRGIADLKNVGDDNLYLTDDGDFGGRLQADCHYQAVLLPNTQHADGLTTAKASVKGIFQPFELGGETILIRSAVKH